MIKYLSTSIIPVIILVILIVAIIEKNKIFDTFLIGAKEGIEIVIKIFPTLVGIFLAIGALKSSGILDFIITLISPITNLVKIPAEVLPLALLRPISGSASMAIATNIIENVGVDSITGLIASTIMGSTETTFYTIAIYTSAINVKKTRGILVPALIADLTGIIASVVIWHILS